MKHSPPERPGSGDAIHIHGDQTSALAGTVADSFGSISPFLNEGAARQAGDVVDREMIPFDWYTRAKERIERFLPRLDKNLEVDVDSDVITPRDGSPEYTTFVLAFSHPSNPKLHWTMEIRMDEGYIEHQLEEIVTQIYFERVE